MKKQKARKGLSALLIAAMLVSMLWVPALAEETQTAEDTPQDLCEKILSGMTTEDKVSQMLMPTFRYVTNADGTRSDREAVDADVTSILQKRGFAGVILFSQNLKSTEKAVRFIDDMQKANATETGRPQLLVAADQEGGIKTRLGQGTHTPGNMALGAVGDVAATQEIGKIIGQELMAMGINYDAAPVVDVNNNPGNPVIGVRSFSDDPQTVATQAVSFMKGLQSTGIVSTLKHFPGHGDTATDSHTGLPSVNKSYEELKKTELVPFRACIDAGAEAIMTAHIQYPQIETQTAVSKKDGQAIHLPATLSKTILTDILRGDMGYQGVIITDAMNMDAINEHFGALDAAKLAMNAGVDIILMPVDTSSAAGIRALDQYVTDVAKMVDSGEISKEKVDAAVLRILKLKEKKGMLDAYDGTKTESRVQEALETVGSKAHHDTEWAIAKRSITLVKNEGSTLPFNKENQKIQILTPDRGQNPGLDYAVSLAKSEGKAAANTVVKVDTPLGSTRAELTTNGEALIRDADQVILVSCVGSPADIDPSKSAWSGAIDDLIAYAHSGGKKVTLLSVQLPFDAARYQTADAIVLAWAYNSMSENPGAAESTGLEGGPNMPAALYLMLTGEAPTGKLPVNVPKVDDTYQYTSETLYPGGYGLTWAEEKKACPKDSTCPIAAFTDADPKEWYHDGVHYVLENKIMNGVGDGLFMPDGSTTRAMVVTMLWRMEGEPSISSDEHSPVTFTDLETGSWYEDAVEWASVNGIVTGYDEKTFAPNDLVTREQFAAILYRYAAFNGDKTIESTSPIGSEYTDAAQVSEWAFKALAWANAQGIVNGMEESKLMPQANATRAQVATMLYRFMARTAEY